MFICQYTYLHICFCTIPFYSQNLKIENISRFHNGMCSKHIQSDNALFDIVRQSLVFIDFCVVYNCHSPMFVGFLFCLTLCMSPGIAMRPSPGKVLTFWLVELAEAIDPAAGLIRLIIHGGWVNKASNRCLYTRLRVNKHLFTRQSSRQWAIHPTAVQ